MTSNSPVTHLERNRPVGEPFSKGNSIHASMDFVQKVHPSAWAPTLERVSPATREVIRGIVLTSHWYPYEVLHDLSMTFCGIIPGGLTSVALRWGAYTIERDLKGGIYRMFLKVASPQLMAQAFGRLWRLYHATGSMYVQSVGNDAVRCLLHGLHLPSPQVTHATIGAAARVLELSGARGVQQKIVAGGGAGDRYCEFVLNWR